MHDAERDLLAYAERQHGVFTRPTALRFGMTERMIESRLGSFRWEAVQPSTFRIVGAPYTYEADVLAAIRSAELQIEGRDGRKAAASCGTCARLREFDGHAAGPDDPIELTVSGSALPLLWWDVVVHRTRSLPDADLDEVDGIPCTTGARLAVDLAGRLGPMPEVVALAEDVMSGRHTTETELHRCASELARGRRHAALLRELTSPGGRDRFRSWLERQGARVFADFGLDGARWNAPVYDRQKLVAVVDALFERYRIAVELDGLRFHTTAAQLARDKARDRRLVLLGYLVLRYSYRELVHSPADVVAEIRDAIALRG